MPSLLALLVVASALSGPMSVVDGDTVDLGSTRIRIANIDAPELRHAKCDAEKRLATVAKRRLEALLSGGTATVHPGDPTTGRKTDRYGRMLATISIGGRDVGEVLVAEGLARPWAGKRAPWCE